MTGLTPEQTAFILTAAYVVVELLIAGLVVWLFTKRHTVRGFLKRVIAHL